MSACRGQLIVLAVNGSDAGRFAAARPPGGGERAVVIVREAAGPVLGLALAPEPPA